MKRLVLSYAQHFLRSPAFIAELIGHSNIRQNDTVLDIGAGSGAITSVLARRCRRVIAYEIEPSAIVALRRNMASHRNVEIVEQDFLRASLPLDGYKVFANIPFSLSSPIVRRLCTADHPPKSIYLIVQKQFAQKMIQNGDHFHGALGMAVAPWWVSRIRRPLKKTDFTPPPAVDTSLLEIKMRDEPLLPRASMEAYMRFIERCYAEPVFFATTHPPVHTKPSQMTVEQWLALYGAIPSRNAR